MHVIKAFVANAEGEAHLIAPNTWVEIKGSNLMPPGDMRIWQESDFVGNTMPTKLDNVSVTVNGKPAYVYYISPTQINILTPPDPMSGPVQVVVNNSLATTMAFTAQALASPSVWHGRAVLRFSVSNWLTDAEEAGRTVAAVRRAVDATA